VNAEPLLLEIGCEEIPARMIAEATAELERRVLRILDEAGLAHGACVAWGGPRRLAVQVDAVAEKQPERDETVLGPPASVAFDAAGQPTRAAVGFATRQGLAPAALQRVETEKGVYAGFRRRAAGRSLDALLGETLAPAIEAMPFPKTMRWGDGTARWVRPVHWLVALHGARVLPLALLGVTASGRSCGHRFLSDGAVEIGHAGRYVAALESARVVADPLERRRRLETALAAAARRVGGQPVSDPELLAEVADLVEWPGVVEGAFDPAFLALPRELLVTTLRHHQKCFSVQSADGELLAAFLAVANTDRDPCGHVRRGNEWVVGGRLEDARFFWDEDRELPLAARTGRLAGVTFHARRGSFADKAARVTVAARRLAQRLALAESDVEQAAAAAGLAKADLVCGLVGEFPELQGVVGGLLLREEGADPRVSMAVYEHHRPAGPADPLPASEIGAVVSAADKLDTLAELLAAGERPTGSRDPLGMRRAANGLLRIALERGWPLSLTELSEIPGAGGPELAAFLHERLLGYLREDGYSTNEIQAVLRPRCRPDEALLRELPDLAARLAAIETVRGREDFRRLVQLTERVDNILTKNAERIAEIAAADPAADPRETAPAAIALAGLLRERAGEVQGCADARRYHEIVEILAQFIGPVDRFFQEVLVIDPHDPGATRARGELLAALRTVLTSHFDIRELAGEAERRAA
jgi:glycyl-tRNA synthetase beta chain